MRVMNAAQASAVWKLRSSCWRLRAPHVGRRACAAPAHVRAVGHGERGSDLHGLGQPAHLHLQGVHGHPAGRMRGAVRGSLVYVCARVPQRQWRSGSASRTISTVCTSACLDVFCNDRTGRWARLTHACTPQILTASIISRIPIHFALDSLFVTLQVTSNTVRDTYRACKRSVRLLAVPRMENGLAHTSMC